VLAGRFAVCRLDPRADPPSGWNSAPFFSLTRTPDELSIVCSERTAPGAARVERGWRCLRVEGPLDFSLTGILAGLTSPLAERGVSVFSISTFDTDYLLVKHDQLAQARAALEEAGHLVREDE
jgi:hypothetical protein